MLPLAQSGKLKPLAILSEQRSAAPDLKDIPTAKEQGLDVVWGQAWGLAAPPETDPALVKWWDDKIAKLVKTKAGRIFSTKPTGAAITSTARASRRISSRSTRSTLTS